MTRTKIALAAALLIGTATAALAENGSSQTPSSLRGPAGFEACRSKPQHVDAAD